jgi:hypothetical protein
MQHQQFFDDDLAKRLAHVEEQSAAPCKLILNGDIFSFDDITALPHKAPVLCPANLPRAKPDNTSENRLLGAGCRWPGRVPPMRTVSQLPTDTPPDTASFFGPSSSICCSARSYCVCPIQDRGRDDGKPHWHGAT